jgi:hypothetical protein
MTDRSVEHDVTVPNDYYAQQQHATWQWHYCQHQAAMQEAAQRRRNTTAGIGVTTFYDDPNVLAKVSRGLRQAMVGINVEEIAQPHRLAQRGR